MKPKRFLIPGLVAAGFGAHDPALAALTHATTTGADDPNTGTLLRTFTQDHYVTLASHSSHSSHSSHASHSSGYGGGGHYSHTSHRSSSGGYDSYPSPPSYSPPTYSPPAPPPASIKPLSSPPTRAAAPPADELTPLSGRTKRFAAIVRRVELALLAQDFYAGPISSTVTPRLRSAIRKFQQARNLEVTGTITPATLDALMISSR